MELNFELFGYVLPYIGKGLVGIFAVTLVIILIVWLLNKVSSVKK